MARQAAIRDALHQASLAAGASVEASSVMTNGTLLESSRVRTLGRIAWHLALTLGEMSGHAGLKVDAPPESAPVPAVAAAILAT